MTPDKIASYSVRLLIIMTCGLYPLLFWGQYAGDAQIHLVYGENAAKGMFFQFNPGEATSGVTSPGFMMLLAGLFSIMVPQHVPVAVKLINLLAQYGIVFFTWIIVRRIVSVKWIPEIAALVTGLIPGSAYNGNVGMENGIFAFVVIATLSFILTTNWFLNTKQNKTWGNLSVALMLGIATWLRPEGIVVAAIAIFVRLLFSSANPQQVPRNILRSLPCLVTYGLIVGFLVLFQYHYTGDLIPSSGHSRIIMGLKDAIMLGPIPFSPKLILRLIAYLPITLCFSAGLYGFWLRMRQADQRWNITNAVIAFSILNFISFFVLYSFVLGGAHLARYIIFLLPLIMLVASCGVDFLLESPLNLNFPQHFRGGRKIITVGFIAGVAWMVGCFSIETYLRYDMCSHEALQESIEAPSNRQKESEAWIARLGNPKNFPISLAAVEVQIRYWLDDRFVIRSLDGRVDPLLFRFVHENYFDHLGYLKARNVNYVIEFPNYNREPSTWSLASLQDMKIGEIRDIQRTQFICEGPGIVRASYH